MISSQAEDIMQLDIFSLTEDIKQSDRQNGGQVYFFIQVAIDKLNLLVRPVFFSQALCIS